MAPCVSLTLAPSPNKIRDDFFLRKPRAKQQQKLRRIMNLIKLEKEKHRGLKSAKFKSDEMCCYLFFMRVRGREKRAKRLQTLEMAKPFKNMSDFFFLCR